MEVYDRRALTLAVTVGMLMLWANILFYLEYNIPIGQVDVDNYLQNMGDKDLRFQEKGLVYEDIYHIIFYKIVTLFGSPRITLLWFPPLLITLLIFYIFRFYKTENNPKVAHLKQFVFVFMTFNIWFFFFVGLYRQLLSILIIFMGFDIFKKNRIIGGSLILLACMVHMNILPIFFILALAYLLLKKLYKTIILSILFGLLICWYLNIFDGIGYLNQPSFFTLLFICTNPLLWPYALSKIKWDYTSIVVILLLISMPFSESGRGMIFLHIILVSVCVDNFLKSDANIYTKIFFILLAAIWFNYMVAFMIKNMIVDSVTRGLDLSLLMDILHIREIHVFY